MRWEQKVTAQHPLIHIFICDPGPVAPVHPCLARICYINEHPFRLTLPMVRD